MIRKALLATALAGSALAAQPALAERAGATDGQVTVGVLVDMSGLYSAHGGPGVVAAVEMAVADFGGKVGDKPIVVKSADYQHKVDVSMSTANRWLDYEGVDMILESADSASGDRSVRPEP